MTLFAHATAPMWISGLNSASSASGESKAATRLSSRLLETRQLTSQPNSSQAPFMASLQTGSSSSTWLWQIWSAHLGCGAWCLWRYSGGKSRSVAGSGSMYNGSRSCKSFRHDTVFSRSEAAITLLFSIMVMMPATSPLSSAMLSLTPFLRSKPCEYSLPKSYWTSELLMTTSPSRISLSPFLGTPPQMPTIRVSRKFWWLCRRSPATMAASTLPILLGRRTSTTLCCHIRPITYVLRSPRVLQSARLLSSSQTWSRTATAASNSRGRAQRMAMSKSSRDDGG